MPVFAPRSGILSGVSTPGTGATLSRFLEASGQASVQIYNRWTTENGDAGWIVDEVRPTGMMPMISWNLAGDGTMSSVANGRVDGVISTVAHQLAALDRPVFIRLDWEFNGSWYPWSATDASGSPRPGNAPEDFVAAWRHVVDTVRAVAPLTTFVWCAALGRPVQAATTDVGDWYPGDEYVGWVAVDAYPGSTPWSTVLNGPGGLADTARFAEMHGKPLMLSEWAMDGRSGDDPDLMSRLTQWMSATSSLKAQLYFDYDGSSAPQQHSLAHFPLAARVFAAWLDGPS